MFSFGNKEAERRREMKAAAGRRPKLERRNAAKNIDYEASCVLTPLEEPPPPLRISRSLDLSPAVYSATTSFRIGGSGENEVDLLCRSLGLSGPEDFAIPIAAWEASLKARSSSDLLPRSRFLDLDRWLPQPENTRSAPDLPVEDGTESAVPSKVVSVRDEKPEEISQSPAHGSGGNDGGMKGIVSPLSTPPPLPASFLTPSPAGSVLEDRSGWTWDSVSSLIWDKARCFSPKDKNDIMDRVRSLDSEVEEEEEEVEEEERVGSGGAWEVLEERETSEDCAGFLTTSNDEELSSKTTEFVFSPNARFKKMIRSWMRGQLLGSGSFGTVYEGISDDGTFIAIKEVSLIDKRSNAQQCIFQLEQEIALLSQFEHENIVQYYGTDKEESKLFIFLELVTQGSLASLYQKYHLRDTQVSVYTRQILNGLNYLHERNVVHRDIKCANILVHANGSVKLADFGLAKEISKFNDLKSCKGSVYWMAPEVVNPRETYGRAPDIWSLGCTVLEMLTRQIPYPNVEWQHAFFKIGRGEQPPIPDHLSSDAQDFIKQCVQVDPNARPTAAQLLEHPFVRRPLVN